MTQNPCGSPLPVAAQLSGGNELAPKVNVKVQDHLNFTMYLPRMFLVGAAGLVGATLLGRSARGLKRKMVLVYDCSPFFIFSLASSSESSSKAF
jgi:hypothetical protein